MKSTPEIDQGIPLITVPRVTQIRGSPLYCTIHPWNEATPLIRAVWLIPRVAELDGVHYTVQSIHLWNEATPLIRTLKWSQAVYYSINPPLKWSSSKRALIVSGTARGRRGESSVSDLPIVYTCLGIMSDSVYANCVDYKQNQHQILSLMPKSS